MAQLNTDMSCFKLLLLMIWIQQIAQQNICHDNENVDKNSH